MRSFPTLRSPRHGEFLKKLREYWEKPKTIGRRPPPVGNGALPRISNQ